VKRPALRTWDERRWRSVALAAIGIGAALRALWILVVHHPFATQYIYSDIDGYVRRAKALASGHFSHYAAFYPPGTHALIAFPLELFGSGRAGFWGAAVLWWLFSSVTPFFAWRLARLLLTPAAAGLTAVLVSLWPLYILYAGYFTSETPAIAFIVAALWLGYRARFGTGRAALVSAAGAGVLGMAALACRPQLSFNLLILGLPLLRRREQILKAAVLVLGAAVIFAAVVVNNSKATGEFTPQLNQDTSLAFFIGHCNVRFVSTADEGRHLFFGFGPPPAIEQGIGHDYRFQNRVVWDEGFFYRKGLDCIRHDGIGHTTLIARHLADMTATSTPWPLIDDKGIRSLAQLTNFLYTLALPVILVAAFLLAREKRRAGRRPTGEGILLAQFACVLIVAVFAFGDPRFRLPYDVFALALLGAVLAHRYLAADEPPRVSSR
jgi:4-amino-4-deoxy-L-arabinose transferase-like glycosyltransferase